MAAKHTGCKNSHDSGTVDSHELRAQQSHLVRRCLTVRQHLRHHELCIYKQQKMLSENHGRYVVHTNVKSVDILAVISSCISDNTLKIIHTNKVH